MEKRQTRMLVGKEAVCDCRTIQEAFEQAAALDGEKEIVILSGTYRENVYLYGSHITVRGLGRVEIIGSKYALETGEDGQPIGTFQTATFFVNGEHIRLENLTITNDSGPGEKVGQALALYVEGTNFEAENCTLKAHQDTLCVGPLPAKQKDGTSMPHKLIRQVYKRQNAYFLHCYIEGTVDFIFGGGEVRFELCQIHSLERPENRESYITAPSTQEGEEGLSFHDCILTADPGVRNVYLGRPWRAYGKAVFENCRIDAHLHPEGWEDWRNAENRTTARFIEKGNHYLGEQEREGWITFAR